MLLTEPGTRIEGPVTEVLLVIFDVTEHLLEELMGYTEADFQAHQHLARTHAALAQAGFVVRELDS